MDKPLGRKTYGSIPHIRGSRADNPGDHYISDGQACIATEMIRDRHDLVVVQEKLDGSCVGVALLNHQLVPLGRAGWPAVSSPHFQHQLFHNWVLENSTRFHEVLWEGDCLVGEWLAQAHGTCYDLMDRDPFVAFDLFRDSKRLVHHRFCQHVEGGDIARAPLLNAGMSCSIDTAFKKLGEHGHYGAVGVPEGCIWRVERNGRVDFLCKFVRSDHESGKYLFNANPHWNWYP